jgi:hypothetical protein
MLIHEVQVLYCRSGACYYLHGQNSNLDMSLRSSDNGKCPIYLLFLSLSVKFVLVKNSEIQSTVNC